MRPHALRARKTVIPSPDPQTITRLLHQAREGDTDAVGSLLPLIYAELQSLALAVFSNERRGHTLQPTALIHEVWLKLAGDLGAVEDRKHFFAIAARAMRQVLADHARAARREKRADRIKRITLDEQLVAESNAGLDLVDFEDSLQRLGALNDRHARMVELRVFGGLTIPETAEILAVSHATVERDWYTVRAWLRRELSSSP